MKKIVAYTIFGLAIGAVIALTAFLNYLVFGFWGIIGTVICFVFAWAFNWSLWVVGEDIAERKRRREEKL